MTVADLLRRSATRWGDKLAIVEPGREGLTFAELMRRVDVTAAALRKLGVDHGDRVALLAHNRLEWVEVFFAAAACNAILVPINPRLTDDEIRPLLADALPSVFITDDASRTSVATSASQAHCILIESDGRSTLGDHAIEAQPLRETDPGSHLLEPQAIVYTSGTTGGPKGIVLTHLNVIFGNFLLQAAEFDLATSDVFLVSTPLCHRVGATRVVTAIGLGSTCVILPKFDPEAMQGAILRYGVTVVGTVPTVVRLLGSSSKGETLPSVRSVLMTGERVTPQTCELARQIFPNARTYPFYAATETGVVTVRQPDDSRPDSCGRPVMSVEIRIDAPGSDGAGEILVRSDDPGVATVAGGYWRGGQVEPFPGGWCRTGDVGRMEADGTLTMLDRKKDIIITGGFNVYCPEVEAALRAHSQISDAAVVGAPDPVWGEAVCAFVVLRSGSKVDGEELQAFCRSRLPGYAVPRRFFPIDELPRNALGKVRKLLLREKAESSP